MDWINPILKVLAKNKKEKRLTSREIMVKVFMLPEMVTHRDQYKEMKWSDQQVIDQLYKDNQNQSNLTFNRLTAGGYIKTESLKKDPKKYFYALNKCHSITEMGLKKLKSDLNTLVQAIEAVREQYPE